VTPPVPLRLRAKPRTVKRCGAGGVTFTVTAKGKPLGGAEVRLGTLHRTTGPRGRARLAGRLARGGRWRAEATRAGYDRARTTVTVRGC
jgi:hypothetical protein